jgi:hypothetical protein
VVRAQNEITRKTPNTTVVSEREIWWASVGENVGSEINGKSAPFSRTVIIYKKLSHGFYFVIPTTTQKVRPRACIKLARSIMVVCRRGSANLPTV